MPNAGRMAVEGRPVGLASSRNALAVRDTTASPEFTMNLMLDKSQ
ncbi:MAG: hypothetical protein BWY82_01399 [Verrucomicrobia bacterium ADurb.Bin474]|nr:MAG: hypothetical protein BWY82_01399 [Verrucomicrobia bacterium ADurb.Bin474]